MGAGARPGESGSSRLPGPVPEGADGLDAAVGAAGETDVGALPGVAALRVAATAVPGGRVAVCLVATVVPLPGVLVAATAVAAPKRFVNG